MAVVNRDEVVVVQSDDVSDDDAVPRLVDQFSLTQNLRRSVVHLPVAPVTLLCRPPHQKHQSQQQPMFVPHHRIGSESRCNMPVSPHTIEWAGLTYQALVQWP